MSHIIDLLGKRFGRLIVVHQAASMDGGAAAWGRVCDCGASVVVKSYRLRVGKTRSCGCWRVDNARVQFTTHGMKRTRTYRTWMSMSNRCRDPNGKNFHYYGGRGIAVCERWRKFENFLADMGERPDGRTLDRRDNDRGYEPDNCRWATLIEQRRNQRRYVPPSN
jgi:hypothetical protein